MKHALNIIVSLGVLATLLWWADTGAVMAQLRDASVIWLMLSAASLTVITVLMAKRWQIVAWSFDIDISLPRAIAEYYIAQLVNLVLPGGVAGDVTRAVRARHAANLTLAAQSVAAERIVGQCVMFILLGAGLLMALLIPGGIAWPAATWVGIAIGLLVFLVMMLLSRRNHTTDKSTAKSTARFLRLTISGLMKPRVASLSLLIVVLLIFSLYACARATGTVIPPTGWITLLPLILSAMLIPLSVGGWGWREGAGAALFPLIGATPSAGIATGIAYGAMMIIAAIPGLFFAWRSSAASGLTPATHSRNSLM